MINLLRLHVPWQILCLAAVDVLVLFGTITTGLAARYTTVGRIFALDSPYLLQVLLYVFVNAGLLLILGAFRRQNLTNIKSLTIIICVGHLLSFVSLTMIFYVFPSTRIWLSTLVPSLLVSVSGVFAVHYLFDHFIAFRRFRRRVLVLGTGSTASRIAQLMQTGHSPMTHCVGFISMEKTSVAVPKEEVLKHEKPLAEFILDQNVDEVVVALEERRNHLPVEALLKLRLQGIQVSDLSTFLEREEGRVELHSLYPSWMIFASGFSAATRVQRLIKRVFDVMASMAILIATLPLLVASGLAVIIEDSGPVFYRQIRIGLNGRHFRLLKFRSMKTNAESDGKARWAKTDDPRITVVGNFLRRSRIDELPQIYNVLSGKMSLIGPRPERSEFVEQLKAQIPFYDYRHSVKPGISGWAQVNYPYGSSIEDSKEKLRYDLYYIKNYSLFFDLLVLLQTIRVVFWPEKVHQIPAHGSRTEAADEASDLDRARSAP